MHLPLLKQVDRQVWTKGYVLQTLDWDLKQPYLWLKFNEVSCVHFGYLAILSLLVRELSPYTKLRTGGRWDIVSSHSALTLSLSLYCCSPQSKPPRLKPFHRCKQQMRKQAGPGECQAECPVHQNFHTESHNTHWSIIKSIEGTTIAHYKNDREQAGQKQIPNNKAACKQHFMKFCLTNLHISLHPHWPAFRHS